MKLLSEVTFGAYLAYSPRGASITSLRSRQLTYCLKNDETLPKMHVRLIDYVAKRMAAERQQLEFGDWLAPQIDLVPMPRSSLIKDDALWPARRIAGALVDAGLGGSVLPCLTRVTPLPRASHVRAEDRPTPQLKFDSLRVEKAVISPREIVIVDDVITTGASVLAAASRLREAFPDSTIRALAIVRTMSPGEIDTIRAPCLGRVSLEGPRAVRRP